MKAKKSVQLKWLFQDNNHNNFIHTYYPPLQSKGIKHIIKEPETYNKNL
jgi:hypothetical protein